MLSALLKQYQNVALATKILGIFNYIIPDIIQSKSWLKLNTKSLKGIKIQ